MMSRMMPQPVGMPAAVDTPEPRRMAYTPLALCIENASETSGSIMGFSLMERCSRVPAGSEVSRPQWRAGRRFYPVLPQPRCRNLGLVAVFLHTQVTPTEPLGRHQGGATAAHGVEDQTI